MVIEPLVSITCRPIVLTGKRPFVEENFQDRKVRQTKSGSGDASRIHLSEGTVGFHENQPKMDTGSVGQAGIGVAHEVIFISRYSGRKTIF